MGVVLNIFDVMEMIGIISFAISGAMVGIRKQLDFFGVLILGIVTAVGGGVLRDVSVRHRYHRHGHLCGQRHPGRDELPGVV